MTKVTCCDCLQERDDLDCEPICSECWQTTIRRLYMMRAELQIIADCAGRMSSEGVIALARAALAATEGPLPRVPYSGEIIDPHFEVIDDG